MPAVHKTTEAGQKMLAKCIRLCSYRKTTGEGGGTNPVCYCRQVFALKVPFTAYVNKAILLCLILENNKVTLHIKCSESAVHSCCFTLAWLCRATPINLVFQSCTDGATYGWKCWGCFPSPLLKQGKG